MRHGDLIDNRRSGTLGNHGEWLSMNLPEWTALEYPTGHKGPSLPMLCVCGFTAKEWEDINDHYRLLQEDEIRRHQAIFEAGGYMRILR